MKERPIIFNGEMVRAILEGRKTQTRRPVKGVPAEFMTGDVAAIVKGNERAIGRSRFDSRGEGAWPEGEGLRCPFGVVGDRLWVKETFRPIGSDMHPFDCYYRASEKNAPVKWIPSIHMPRHFSRITLEIVGIHVERAQDISEEDAKAEGGGMHGGWNADETEYAVNHRGPFSRIWQAIYGNWAENPFVWVIEFKVIK